MSLKRADKIIAVSKFTQDEIIKYYKIDPGKITYIYNAVSEDFLLQDVSEEKIKAVKEKYKFPDKYILYLGTLQPRKNIPTLIEAFILLKSEAKPYSDLGVMDLVVAGGKSHNYDRLIDEVIKKNNFSGKVKFPGYIDEEDKAAVIKGAQVFVFPSFYEGFGVPILEAMSLNVPTVSSGIAPHQEVAGPAALYFNPQVSGELAQKIKEITTSSVVKENLIKKGRAQIYNFSWEKSAEKYKRIFATILN